MADPAVAALAAAGDGGDAAASADLDPADLGAGDWPVTEQEIARLGAAPTGSQDRAGAGAGGGPEGGDYERTQAEAKTRGFGELFSAFGGGRDGLEACAAGRTHLSVHVKKYWTSVHARSALAVTCLVK